MTTIDVDYDPTVWAEVPQAFPIGPYADQAEWARAVCGAYADPQAGESASERLAAIAMAIPIETRPGLVTVLWYRPDPDARPLIVNVYAIEDDGFDGETLSALADSYDAEWVRPPAVDAFESARFGEVSRVIGAYRENGVGRLILRIVVVGRAGGVLVRLDAMTPDLSGGALARDDIVELMDSISMADDASASADPGVS